MREMTGNLETDVKTSEDESKWRRKDGEDHGQQNGSVMNDKNDRW
jgi:hypothetical protein